MQQKNPRKTKKHAHTSFSCNQYLYILCFREEFDFVQRKFRGGKYELRWIGLRKEHPGTPYKWVNGDTAGYLPWVSGYTGMIQIPLLTEITLAKAKQ